MKKTKFAKWSRLLVTVVMVLTLGMMLMPVAVSAQEPCDTCPQDPCELQVNILMPDDCAEITKGDTFWVNAAVAKPQHVDQINDVTATISADPDCAVEVLECCTQFTTILDNCNPVADFWWKLKCKECGQLTLTVDASSSTPVPAPCPTGNFAGSDSIIIKQVPVVCPPCLEVEIIECPTEPIAPSNTFGVKALIHNRCECLVCDVDATIYIENVPPCQLDAPADQCDEPECIDEPRAVLLDGYPMTFDVGCIYPGRAEEVGWTLHCTEGGDVKITVDATCTPPECRCDGEEEESCPDPCVPPTPPDPCECVCEVVPDFCIVEQICPAILDVDLGQVPEKICVANPTNPDCESCFYVVATVCETCGDTGINNVEADLILTGDYTLPVVGPDDPAYPNTAEKTNCPPLGPGECTDIYWLVCCDGPADLTIDVQVTGNDAVSNEPLSAADGTLNVEQIDSLMVEFMEPDYAEKINVCETFPATVRVTNCTDVNQTAVWVALDLNGTDCVDIAEMTADIVHCPESGLPDEEDVLVVEECGMYWVKINCGCACCWTDVTFTLECTCSGMEDCVWVQDSDILRTAVAMSLCGDELDDDDVAIQQMCKAHLEGSVEVFEGTVGLDNFEACEPIKAITVCEYMTVVATVANLGEATAEGVEVTLGWSGNATTQMDPTVQLGDIGCHGAAKAVWEFHCEGPGRVRFWVESISGMDANTELAIHSTNIIKGCPVDIDQIPLTVTIIQPLTCTDFVELESFTIKARIDNGSDQGKVLDGVMAKLRWDRECEGCDPQCGDFEIQAGPNPVDVTPGEDVLLPGETAEVTWQVRCCNAGDTTFWVDVWTEEGLYELDIQAEPQTIHQWEPGGVKCRILSPKLHDYDVCRERCEYEAYIATGQEFALTAKLMNTANRPFLVDTLELNIEGSNAEIVGGPTPAPDILLAPRGEDGDEVIVSWDLLCTEPGGTELEVYVSGVSVMDDQTAGVRDCHDCDVKIKQYSAAHLIVEIDPTPPSPIDVCTEFPVTARVTNIGDADAWEVQATISVFPEGSARVSANDQYGSYTRNLGNLIGHGVSESEEITWLMHCKVACDTTITVTATGYDEYSYEVKQICASDIIYQNNPGAFQVTCCELLLDGTPGAPIPPRFIEPDSVTVKQMDPDDGDGDGDGTVQSGNFDIVLGTGWNLISSPWYVEPGDRAPADFLAEIVDLDSEGNLEIAYGFNACGPAVWQTYIPDGPGTLTVMRDGFGYWLLMNDPDTLPVVGSIAPMPPGTMPEYQVCEGWNLIGVLNGEDPVSVADYLEGTDYKTVYGFNNATNSYVQLLSTSLMQPGQGYWVVFLSPGTLYPGSSSP